ncbi:MAG TPA: hypothetical protein VHW23_42350, partial [Kofleriaceae bacterium]|nr:hypothetical protein [Kofleriaceae bacterium]
MQTIGTESSIAVAIPVTRLVAPGPEVAWSGAPVSLRGYRPEHTAGDADLARAAAMIDAARRPVILAGHGIVKAGASALLGELVERTGIPVAATLLGLGGFPASHPLSLGMMGMHGEAWV